jgi:hypothetical protein
MTTWSVGGDWSLTTKCDEPNNSTIVMTARRLTQVRIHQINQANELIRNGRPEDSSFELTQSTSTFNGFVQSTGSPYGFTDHV